jgi:hypothetical protein
LWQVHISSQTESQIPFGVGVASDPMALRRGGKKLPMEDVCYHQWPLPGVDQVIVPFQKKKKIKSAYSAVDCIFLYFF